MIYKTAAHILRVTVIFAAASALLLPVSVSPAEALTATKFFSTGSCSMMSKAQTGWTGAYTHTYDVNDGCDRLSAGLRYKCVGRSSQTLWRSSRTAKAIAPHPCGHVQSYSIATDWEWGRSVHSGWWG